MFRAVNKDRQIKLQKYELYYCSSGISNYIFDRGRCLNLLYVIFSDDYDNTVTVYKWAL